MFLTNKVLKELSKLQLLLVLLVPFVLFGLVTWYAPWYISYPVILAITVFEYWFSNIRPIKDGTEKSLLNWVFGTYLAVLLMFLGIIDAIAMWA